MTRLPMTQAVAADYADAMLVARRAKNVLGFFLTLILLTQIGVFFTARFVPSVKVRTDVTTTSSPTGSSTSVTLLEHKTSDTGERRQLWSPILEQVIDVSDFVGVVLAIVLPIILLLVLTIMLVGRLVGVSHVTSAFCWSILFLLLLFPWQSLLNRDVHTEAVISSGPPATLPADAEMPNVTPDVRFPGTLYTFPELRRHYDFPNNPIPVAILGWGALSGCRCWS